MTTRGYLPPEPPLWLDLRFSVKSVGLLPRPPLDGIPVWGRPTGLLPEFLLGF
jgi:hypothetical protein